MTGVFGTKVPGAAYRDREGAYAVILDGRGMAALVEAPVARGEALGIFLIGGGIERGEDPEACIRRECLEETGREVRVGEYLCTGEEYLFAPGDRTYLHVTGRCYLAQLGEQVRKPVEHDHTLRWVPAEHCKRMFLQYQAWAVQLAWEKKEKKYDDLRRT